METPAEIIEAINAELDAQAEANEALAGMSTSNVSEWISMKAKVSAACYSLVRFWLAFRAEVMSIVSAGKYGTAIWWQQTMLNYQDGDALPEGNATYAIVDESKRIITRCAISKNSNGVLIVKVAGVAGVISSGQFSRVNDYITDIKPFCCDHRLVSLPADDVKTLMDIRYDGKLIQVEIKALVDAAITGYLASVKFDGAFNINRFRDKIEQVPGVVDVDITNVQIRPNGGDYTTVIREYTPASGYYNWLIEESTTNMIAS
jgi:hypothetical protein